MDSKFTSHLRLIVLVGFLLFPISAFSEDTDSLVVSENGNVGVGTTTPDSKLHIYDGELTITDSPNPFIWFKNKDTGELNSIATSGKDLYIGGSNEGGALRFRTKTNWGQSMHIDPSGNVGIGVPNPQAKLEIVDNVGQIEGVLIKDTVHINTHYLLRLQADSDADAGGPFETVFTAAGNVGIGTTNPGYKLDVNGTISAQTVNTQNVVLEDLSVNKTLIQNMQQQIATLQGQVATLQGQVATLQGQTASQQASIDSIWAWINNHIFSGGP